MRAGGRDQRRHADRIEGAVLERLPHAGCVTRIELLAAHRPLEPLLAAGVCATVLVVQRSAGLEPAVSILHPVGRQVGEGAVDRILVEPERSLAHGGEHQVGVVEIVGAFVGRGAEAGQVDLIREPAPDQIGVECAFPSVGLAGVGVGSRVATRPGCPVPLMSISQSFFFTSRSLAGSKTICQVALLASFIERAGMAVNT